MPTTADLFPPDFVWGAATASYQIEGAVDADGRGESIWDRFAAAPGNVRNGETGTVACDFYNRWPEDVELIAELGLTAFRFSVAWPRVLPNGVGAVNARGLDFYDRLVDALLERGIEPYVTLYHWDLPQALEDRGGWTARETAEAFAAYAAAVAARLGDRVDRWITINEPWVAAWLGYGRGLHAPGRRSDGDAVAAGHHLLLGHGLALEAVRAEVPAAECGITLNLDPVYAASESEHDRAAARFVDGLHNRWFLDPVFRGEYPSDMLERFSPPVRDGDLATIAGRIDFLGVNNYSRAVIRADGSGDPEWVRSRSSEYTEMGWEVYPDGLHDLLVRVARDYDPPKIYVTENGAAFSDVRTHDGEVRDPERRDFLASHIDAVGRARRAGAPLAGYFVWSFLDNFEWAQGYSKRFGLVYVDYPTQERVPKDSFRWYRDFIGRVRGPEPSPAGVPAG